MQLSAEIALVLENDINIFVIPLLNIIAEWTFVTKNHASEAASTNKNANNTIKINFLP